MPYTVPVNEGLANIVALLSLVTFPSPTITGVMPDTVPVNEGLAIFAFKPITASTLVMSPILTCPLFNIRILSTVFKPSELV